MRIGSTLLLLVATSIGAWLLLHARNDPARESRLRSLVEERTTSRALNPEVDLLGQSGVAEEILRPDQQQHLVEIEWEYNHVFPRLAAEPVDATWAPQAEAVIDNALRSVGGYLRDVKVNCRTTRCGAIVLYRPELFALDSEQKES